MNIRKIIKEEIDSFDWASDVGEVFIGSEYKNRDYTYTFTVDKILPNGKFNVRRYRVSSPTDHYQNITYTEKELLDTINAGTLSPIKEEMDDFEWVSDEQLFHVGTIIKVRTGIHDTRFKIIENDGIDITMIGITPSATKTRSKVSIDDAYQRVSNGGWTIVDSELKENFDWTIDIGKDFDVCDLVKLPRDIVGQDITIVYGGHGTRKKHVDVKAKVMSVTEPWNENIKLHLQSSGGQLPYVGCGWRFKFND